MFGASYELTEAAQHHDNDYWISRKSLPEGEDPADHRYPAWEAEDDAWTLIVGDAAPDTALNAADEEGFDPVWASDANRTQVKRVNLQVREETAYYLEEAPDDRYRTVGRRETLELLDQRGIEVGSYVDSWWYPEKREFVAVFDRVDESGERGRMVWRSDSISTAERKLILDGEPIEDDSPATHEQIAETIYRNSTLTPNESEIIACWIKGIDDYRRIAERIDSSYQAVSQSVYFLKGKFHRRAWEWEYVLPYVSDELLPEDASAGDGTLKTVADVECAYEDGEEMYWFREKESEELNADFPFRIGDEGAAAD